MASVGSTTSTGSTNPNGMFTNTLRLTGLSGSGIDTDAIIKQMMAAERVPLDKLKQQQQLTQWKQDAYRDMINLTTGFQNSFFNVATPSSNMLSPTVYKAFKTGAVDEGTHLQSNDVTITANADASAGTHTIQIKTLAAAESITSAVTSGGISADLESSAAILTDPASSGDPKFISNLTGKSLTLTIDGTSKVIQFDSTYSFTSVDDLINNSQYGLNKLIGDAFGSGKVVLTNDSGKLKFAAGTGVTNITVSSGYSSSDALGILNISSGSSNRINIYKSLGDLQTSGAFKNGLTFASDGTLKFTINNKAFSFDSSTSLSTMMSQINSDPTANVNMQYDQVTDTFEITSKQLGAGSNINITENSDPTAGGNFFGTASALLTSSITGSSASSLDFSSQNYSFYVGVDGAQPQQINVTGTFNTAGDLVTYLQGQMDTALGANTVQVSADSNGVLNFKLLSGSSLKLAAGTNDALAGMHINGNFTQGVDANVTIDGQNLVRSSNNITLSGVTYNLLKAGGNVQDVSVTQDVDTVFNNIKSFVDKYNDLISKVNAKVDETYDRDYQPLTDEQKSQMSDTDVTNWETKAKTGLLQDDDLLQGMLNGMRQALDDGVDGVSVNIFSIGISTSSNYADHGKLVIDETALRSAIQNNPDAVANLFTQNVSNSSLGISASQGSTQYNQEGLAGRLNDILDNYVGTMGSKGVLLQQAGLQGDTTEFDNSLSKEILDYNTQINDMTSKLADKETALYNKFSQLESYISQMNSQSSWLSSQLSGG